MLAPDHQGVLAEARSGPTRLARTCLLLCFLAASVGHAAESIRGQSDTHTFDMLAPDSLPEAKAAFFAKSVFKGECAPCKDPHKWRWVEKQGYHGKGCNPECAAEVLSATFACQANGIADLPQPQREVRFTLEPLRPDASVRLLSQVAHGAELVLESDGRVKAARVTSISLTLRDYDELWSFSVAAVWGDTKLNDLIKWKLEDRELGFTMRIGKQSYEFRLPDNEFEKAFRHLLAECQTP